MGLFGGFIRLLIPLPLRTVKYFFHAQEERQLYDILILFFPHDILCIPDRLFLRTLAIPILALPNP
jgi:hypothetical protein